MAGQLAMRVVAKQPGPDVHARKTETLGRKTRDLFVGQPRADGQGLEIAGFLPQLFEAALVARRDLHQPAQRLDGFFEVADLGRRDFQCVGRVIGRQHDTVAVQDQATVGHDGDHRRAVALRLLIEVVMADHLQINQPGRHQCESKQHRQAGHQHAHTEAGQVSFDVAQFSHGPVTRQ
jgi:hypothetical protein